MAQKVIAFIPVRGGSKSIPLKNIQMLAGQPLLHWTLRAALACGEIDEVVIATDHREIEKSATGLDHRKLKIFRRSDKNAKDESSTESVMLEYLEQEKPSAKDQFILIQATNPFLRSQDLSLALKKIKKEKAQSLLSVVRTKRFFWKKDSKPVNYDFKMRPRRQDFDGLFMENGAFYISTVGAILKSKNRLSGKISLFEMDEISGFEIDEPNDWAICEALMKNNGFVEGRDFSKVKLFLSDMDGVLTDAGMYYSENGDELKKFNTLDGMGLQLLMAAHIKVGIITGEETKLAQRRAEKLRVPIIKQGVKDKLPVVMELCRSLDLNLSEVAYIGDDVNDEEVLRAVGFPACPSTAVDVIQNIPGIIRIQRRGGDGAVREFAEMILKERP